MQQLRQFLLYYETVIRSSTQQRRLRHQGRRPASACPTVPGSADFYSLNTQLELGKPTVSACCSHRFQIGYVNHYIRFSLSITICSKEHAHRLVKFSTKRLVKFLHYYNLLYIKPKSVFFYVEQQVKFAVLCPARSRAR